MAKIRNTFSAHFNHHTYSILKFTVPHFFVELEKLCYTVGGLEIETCITVSGPPPPEDTAL
jgi:hypothetical protein